MLNLLLEYWWTRCWRFRRVVLAVAVTHSCGTWMIAARPVGSRREALRSRAGVGTHHRAATARRAIRRGCCRQAGTSGSGDGGTRS